MLRHRLILVGVIFFMSGCARATQWISPGTHSYPNDVATPMVWQPGQLQSHWLKFRNDGLSDAEDDQVAIDPDGKLWYTEVTIESVGFITMHHQQANISVAPFRGFAEPTGITLGPNRKIWFADALGVVGMLTSLDANASVVRYPTPGYSPRRIVAGPDGNLWVTVRSTDRTHSAIDKVTTAGVITAYPVPTNSDVEGIVVGPDSNIWFVELVGKLGKLVPSTGAITEYAADSGFYPYNIAADSKNLYVAGGNTLGVMTTTGEFSERTDPTLSAEDLALGPDGHIWVDGLDSTLSYWTLARVGPNGFENHVDLESNGGSMLPGGLIAGPDENIWFVAEGAVGDGSPRTFAKPTVTRRPVNALFPPKPRGEIVVYVRLLMTVTPSSLQFSAIGQSQNIVISEKQYSGGWSARSSDPAVAIVTQDGSPDTFTVQSTGIGSASIDIADTLKNHKKVMVTVVQPSRR